MDVMFVIVLIIIGAYLYYNYSSEEMQKQQQIQERQAYINRGIAACNSADDPAPEARAPRHTGDAIDDLASTIDVIGAKMDVSNIQSKLDEATLAGNTALINQLHYELEAAKRTRDIRVAENERRHKIARAHDQALKDIADCREYRASVLKIE
jgi:hypothetical protein